MWENSKKSLVFEKNSFLGRWVWLWSLNNLQILYLFIFENKTIFSRFSTLCSVFNNQAQEGFAGGPSGSQLSFQSSAITYQTSNSVPDTIQQVERCKREEQERANGTLKNTTPHLRDHRLQLYVFIIRCIAMPFNTKHPTDFTRRPKRIVHEDLALMKQSFHNFLQNSGSTSVPTDEAFNNATHGTVWKNVQKGLIFLQLIFICVLRIWIAFNEPPLTFKFLNTKNKYFVQK